MDEIAKTRLEQSISHWERIAECKTVADVYAEGLGPASCALCEEYLHFGACFLCPVFEKTKRTGCADTPYYEFTRAFNDFCKQSRSAKRTLPPDVIAAAKEELEFLKSLREP